MEIRDVIHNLREENLRLSRRLEALQSQVELLERFTWNLLKEVREAMSEGVQILWDLDETLDEASTVDSTVDSPERTNDATLF